MLPHRMPLTGLLVPPRPSPSRRIGIVSICSDLAERDRSLVGHWIVEELCPSASRRNARLRNPPVHGMGHDPESMTYAAISQTGRCVRRVEQLPYDLPDTDAADLPVPLRHSSTSACQHQRLTDKGLHVKNKTRTSARRTTKAAARPRPFRCAREASTPPPRSVRRPPRWPPPPSGVRPTPRTRPTAP